MFQITEFKHKDRMSEAEQYVIQLQDITKKLEDFNEEVRSFHYIFLFSLQLQILFMRHCYFIVLFYLLSHYDY